MKVHVKKEHQGATEYRVISEDRANKYKLAGWVVLSEKVSFSSKIKEDEAWMERFGD